MPDHTPRSSHDPPAHPTDAELPAGWSRPKPEHVPRPTYWPAVLALGTTLLFWGLITTFFISVVGLALLVIALAGWIREMTHGE